MPPIETLGPFQETSEAEGEGLVISFRPGSLPLRQRWRNNGLSADFLADYVATFLPAPGDGFDTSSEARGAVSFIANELIENAMKYGRRDAERPIRIGVELEAEGIRFTGCNVATAEQARVLRAFAAELDLTDPAHLYLRRVEEDMAGGREMALGFLTMVTDYGARLAWRFEALADESVAVTVQVYLNIAMRGGLTSHAH